MRSNGDKDDGENEDAHGDDEDSNEDDAASIKRTRKDILEIKIVRNDDRDNSIKDKIFDVGFLKILNISSRFISMGNSINIIPP